MEANKVLKTIIVEDEVLALERLERIARQEPGLEVVATFTQSNQALAYAYSHEVDLVLLDIEMPHIDGLTLADMVFEHNPVIDLIFVTAYDKYAVEAFQANAVGYLLKPIQASDLHRTLLKIQTKRHLMQGHQHADSHLTGHSHTGHSHLQPVRRLKVQVLGDFACYPFGQPDQAIKWRTAKAEELMALLIHQRHRPISKERLYDLLWPDMTADKAAKNLHAVSYYLRDALSEKGFSDLIVRDKGHYRLQVDQLDVDFYAMLDYSDQVHHKALSLEQLNHMSALNLGQYFESKNYEWAREMATWLETQFEHLDLLRCKLMQANDDAYGLQVALENLIARNGLCEEAYTMLIQHYLAKGQEARATLWYQKYEKRFREDLGIEPSSHVKQLIK